MVNYQNSLVYKLECKNQQIMDIYVGSTCNFNRRKAQHKSLCTNENSKAYNLPVYQFIRANGGWFNWKMILIEEVPCQNKKQLNRIEAKYIKDLRAVLNCCIPCRTDKEYREDNKELLTEKAKKYREENKEIINEQRKQKVQYDCGSVITKSVLARHKKSKKHQQWEQQN